MNPPAPPSTSYTQRNRVFLVVLVALLLFFVFSYMNLVLEHTALKKEVAQATTRLDSAYERGLRLEQQLAYVQTDGYKETAAREMLGLVRPGDRVFAIIPTDAALDIYADETQGTEATDVRLLPVWQQWLDLFNLKISLS